uniref:NADH-ubiquinone oxidoreductase chain 4L n=1 Tax=Micromelo undatus TaxID=340426 RepID=E6Y184_MICUD|nr:NADH dehydrogenase subunit 4L [Micromelo undatus]ABK92257.1 NADH dehydrogenase subunit 4L [Micromelo undatus]
MDLLFSSIMVFVLAVTSFCVFQVHILSLLISLEAVMLSLLGILYSFCLLSFDASSAWILLLTFAACEAALGLSLLVSILRLRGNDFIQSFSTLNF